MNVRHGPPVVVALEDGGQKRGMRRTGTIAGAFIVGGATALGTAPSLAWAMFGAGVTLSIVVLVDETGDVLP